MKDKQANKKDKLSCECYKAVTDILAKFSYLWIRKILVKHTIQDLVQARSRSRFYFHEQNKTSKNNKKLKEFEHKMASPAN